MLSQTQIRNFVFAGLAWTMAASIASAQGGLGAPVRANTPADRPAYHR